MQQAVYPILLFSGKPAPHSDQIIPPNVGIWGLEDHLMEFPDKSSELLGGHIHPVHHMPWVSGLGFQSV